MILLIDNYDSFTFNIYHYIGELGAKVKVLRNDKVSIPQILEINPKAIILSPGPCTPNEAGICLDLVKNLYKKYPILGICLGHQSIGQAFDGKIIQCSEIMHGKVCVIKHNNHLLFKDISSSFLATRYHSLIIEKNTLNTEDLIKPWFIPTGSILYRKVKVDNYPNWISLTDSGDIALMLYLSTLGKFYYFNKVMYY